MLGNSLARLTKGGTRHFGGTSKHFCRRMKTLQRWSYPRGTFSSSSSKRLPTTVLKRGTSASGTDLCGLTISILPAACMSSLLHGSANSSAVIRPVRVLSSTDSHVIHNIGVRYRCIKAISIKVSIAYVKSDTVRLDIQVHVNFVW